MKSNGELQYSVVIRTLGNSGEKYRKMLEAIERQTVSPMEIVVVIPHGYTLDHMLGKERIVHSEKGMVSQRAVGIEEAQGEYLLVLDDDLDFPPDFVEIMYYHMIEKNLDCVLAFGSGYNDIQSKGGQSSASFTHFAKRIRGAFTGQYFYSNRKSDYFDTITRTAGHRAFINHKEKPCQTGCFQCFFIKNKVAKGLHFEKEKWLEQGRLSQYAAYDDAVFFYKLFLSGGAFSYTMETTYVHLDAGAGRFAKSKLTAKRNRLYCIARNRTIFWSRFIMPSRPGLLTLLGGLYGLGNYALYSVIINLYPKNWSAISALFAGYRDAFNFIRNK